MTELIRTNFVHNQEQQDQSIAPDAPYTIFEPSVEGLDRNEILREVKKWAEQIGVEAPYTTPLGGDNVHTLGEILDDRGDAFLEEVTDDAPAPEAMTAILLSVAALAERSGFSRERARFRGSFMFNDPETDPNLNMHSDGLNGIVNEDTQTARAARFIYPLGPGAIIFPGINAQGKPMEVDYTAPTNIRFVDSPSELQLINLPRGAVFTDEELDSVVAQQIVPGAVLAFDMTRTFWHQAHGDPRPILVIDVEEVT